MLTVGRQSALWWRWQGGLALAKCDGVRGSAARPQAPRRETRVWGFEEGRRGPLCVITKYLWVVDYKDGSWAVGQWCILQWQYCNLLVATFDQSGKISHDILKLSCDELKRFNAIFLFRKAFFMGDVLSGYVAYSVGTFGGCNHGSLMSSPFPVGSYLYLLPHIVQTFRPLMDHGSDSSPG